MLFTYFIHLRTVLIPEVISQISSKYHSLGLRRALANLGDSVVQLNKKYI